LVELKVAMSSADGYGDKVLDPKDKIAKAAVIGCADKIWFMPNMYLHMSRAHKNRHTYIQSVGRQLAETRTTTWASVFSLADTPRSTICPRAWASPQ
jgi:hypothetical protein